MGLPKLQDEYEYIDLYTQLERLSPNMIGEIIDGQLYVHPRPAPKHILTTSSLGVSLGPFQKGQSGPGGWWIFDEPEIHFVVKTEVVVPDLAGWKRERLPKMPDTAYFAVVPDWVCEVLSPGNKEFDLEKKQLTYEKYGVAYYWIVDPIKKTLEVLVLQEGKYQLKGTFTGNEKINAVPFHEITMDLQYLWAE